MLYGATRPEPARRHDQGDSGHACRVLVEVPCATTSKSSLARHLQTDSSAYSAHPSDVYPDVPSQVLFQSLETFDFSASPNNSFFNRHIPINDDHTTNRRSVDALKAVMALRARNPEVVTSIPPAAWVHLVAWSARHPVVINGTRGLCLDLLLGDFLECLSTQLQRGEDRLVQAYQDAALGILRLVSEDYNGARPCFDISNLRVLDLFYALSHSMPQSAFPSAVLVRVVEAMLKDSHFTVHIPFLRSVYASLIMPPREQESSSSAPTGLRERALWAAIRLVSRLLTPMVTPGGRALPIPARFMSLALEIFASLSSAGCIPHYLANIAYQTVSQLVNSPSDIEADAATLRFATVKVVTLASFKWGWHDRALTFLETLPEARWIFRALEKGNLSENLADYGSGTSPPPITPRNHPEGFVDLLGTLVENALLFPTQSDFNFASAIIMAYSYHSSHHLELTSLSPSLMLSYYNSSTTFPLSPATAAVFKGLAKAPSPQSPPRMPLNVAANLLHYHSTAVDPSLVISSVIEQPQLAQPVDPDFVLEVANLGRLQDAYLLWSRAKAFDPSYPQALICGDLRIATAIIRACIEQRDSAGPVGPEGLIPPLELASLVLQELENIRVGRGVPPLIDGARLEGYIQVLRTDLDNLRNGLTAPEAFLEVLKAGLPTSPLAEAETMLLSASQGGFRGDMLKAVHHALSIAQENPPGDLLVQSLCRKATFVALHANDLELALKIWKTGGPGMNMKTHRFNDTLRDDLVHAIRIALQKGLLTRNRAKRALKELGSADFYYNIKP